MAEKTNPSHGLPGSTTTSAVPLGPGSFVFDITPINNGTESDSGVEGSPEKPEVMHKCVVPFCLTVDSKGFSFFPKDPIRKQAWMDIFGLTLANVNPTSRVCHSHFAESNFSVPKATSLGKRKRLKFSAIPDLNLPESKLPKLDHLISMPDYNIGDDVDISQATLAPSIPLEFHDNDHDYPGSSFVSQTLSEMDLYIIQLKNETKKLKKEIEVANNKLKNYEAGNLPQNAVRKIVHDALSHSFLSPVQIDWLLSRKKRHRSKKWGNREFEKVGISQIFSYRNPLWQILKKTIL